MLTGGDLLSPGMDHATISWILTSCFTWSLQALPTDYRSDCSHVQAACWSAIGQGGIPHHGVPLNRQRQPPVLLHPTQGYCMAALILHTPGLHSEWPAKEPQ